MAKASMTLFALTTKFLDEASAEAWFAEQRWPDGKARLSASRLGEHAVGMQAQDDALPLPREGVRQALLAQDRHGHAVLEARVAGDRHAHPHQPRQGRVEPAPAQGALRFGQDRVAPGAPHPRDVGRERRSAAGGRGGPAEGDEAYFGGLEKNKHRDKKLRAGRGTVGKTPVAGVLDRAANRIHVAVVPRTDRAALVRLVVRRTTPRTAIYTDQAPA